MKAINIIYDLLHVESGEEETATFEQDAQALFVASIIKAMTDHGYVVTGIRYDIKDRKEN